MNTSSLSGSCSICSAQTNPKDQEFCFICDDLKDICWNCMAQHLTESHTQAEYMKAQVELLA